MAQTVKNLPAMQEAGVRSLGWQDPLKKGMAVHSSILSWRISWTEEPGELQSIWSQRATELNWSKYSVQIHSTRPQLLMPYFLISGVTKALSDLHLCAGSWRYPRGLPFPPPLTWEAPAHLLGLWSVLCQEHPGLKTRWVPETLWRHRAQ